MTKLILTRITDVRPHGDNLSIVSVDGHEVVANRKEDGSFRWEAGEACVYVPENIILPEDVLRERGYWNDEKGKGLLGGSKGNRVKMQRFAGVESRGLLFKTDAVAGINPVYRFKRGSQWSSDDGYAIGDDVSEFFGAQVWSPE